MPMKLSTGLRNALLDTASFKQIFDGGVIKVFGGTPPATADDAEGTGQVLLTITKAGVTFEAGNVSTGISFGSATNGTLSKNPNETWNGVVSQSGTATWFRIYDNSYTTGESTTAKRIQGTVGTFNADMLVTSANFVQGATITIDSFSITLPTR